MARKADFPLERPPHPLTLRAGALIVLLIFGAVILLHRAWDATRLREAYIPALTLRLSRAPRNASVEALLGARLTEAHRYPEAAAAYRRAVDAGENNLLVWELWSASAAASNDLATAKGVLGYARRQAVPGIDAAIARCQSLGPSPNPAEFAAAACPEGPAPLIAELAPGSFLNGLSVWWGRRHPSESGYATRKAWVTEEPKNAHAQRLWGEALLKNGDIEDAGAALQRAVDLAPGSPGAHLAMGQALMAMGQVGEAGLQFEACLKLKKDCPPALIGLGQVALDRQIAPLSVAAFRKATAADPRSADAWIGMGRADQLLGYNPRSGLAAFQKAASLAPKRTDYFDDYATVLEANQQPDKAEALLRKRLRAAPGDSNAHLLLGRLLLDNRPDAARQLEAERELREALRLAPHSAETEVQLAELLSNSGKESEAIPLLQNALKDDPYQVTALTDLAKAYQEQRRVVDARQAAQRASALARYVGQMKQLDAEARRRPLDMRVHLELASLYKSGGEIAKAQEELRAAEFIRAQAASTAPGKAAGRAGSPGSATLPSPRIPGNQ